MFLNWECPAMRSLSESSELSGGARFYRPQARQNQKIERIAAQRYRPQLPG
jgi:hypothetical protein